VSRQLINLAGALGAVVILALGILLVALPMFNQARATDKQADETAQTNGIYDIQVETLRGQQAELRDLERDLAALRSQIPATELNDEVFELVGEAVAESGVSLVSVSAAEIEAWTPPAAADAEDDPAASAPAPVEATDPAAGAAETPPADAGTTDAGTTTEAVPAPVEVDPRQVVPFTIVMNLQDAAQAARFIDALREDDRLLTIEHAVLTENEENLLQLTVNARSLVLLQK
jgi:hypothetical protein